MRGLVVILLVGFAQLGFGQSPGFIVTELQRDEKDTNLYKVIVIEESTLDSTVIEFERNNSTLNETMNSNTLKLRKQQEPSGKIKIELEAGSYSLVVRKNGLPDKKITNIMVLSGKITFVPALDYKSVPEDSKRKRKKRRKK